MNRHTLKFVLLGGLAALGVISRSAYGTVLVLNPPPCASSGTLGPVGAGGSASASPGIFTGMRFAEVANLLDALYRTYLGSNGIATPQAIVQSWLSYANCARLSSAQLQGALLAAASNVLRGFSRYEIRRSVSNGDYVFVRTVPATTGVLLGRVLSAPLIGAGGPTTARMPIYELTYEEGGPSNLERRLSSTRTYPGLVVRSSRIIAYGSSLSLPGMRLLPGLATGSPRIWVY